MREDQYSGSGNNESSEDDATYEEGGVVDQRSPQTVLPDELPRKLPRELLGELPREHLPSEAHASPSQRALPHNTYPDSATNPYKEGTKKFLVAERLIAGEVDRGKVS